jgi:hypothetical protein
MKSSTTTTTTTNCTNGCQQSSSQLSAMSNKTLHNGPKSQIPNSILAATALLEAPKATVVRHSTQKPGIFLQDPETGPEADVPSLLKRFVLSAISFLGSGHRIRWIFGRWNGLHHLQCHGIIWMNIKRFKSKIST